MPSAKSHKQQSLGAQPLPSGGQPRVPRQLRTPRQRHANINANTNANGHAFPLFVSKAVQAIRRDAILFTRSTVRRKPKSIVMILALLLLMVVWSVVKYRRAHDTSRFASVSNVRRFGSLSLSTTHCACPLSSTAENFASALLETSHFVARMRHVPTSDDANASSSFTMQIHTMFRGHAAAVRHNVHIPFSKARACFTSRRHSLFPTSRDWLLISGPLQNGSTQLSRNGSSIATTFHAQHAHCPVQEADLIWLTPWHLLTPEVQVHLQHDDGSTLQWWRNTPPWFEVADAMARAGNISKSNQSTKDSAPAQGEWWLQPGVSIVAACKDRTETLSAALSSWLAALGIDEIIIVDWTSKPPIATSLPNRLASDARVTIVRVEDQTDWMLTRAYNLGFRFATQSKLLKLDCDTKLAQDFVDAHPIARTSFYSGNWKALDVAGSTNALHANGVLFAYRDDVLGVGAFDERVVTYGWDDTDLTIRLAQVRTAHTLHYEKIEHLPHSARLRTKRQGSHTILSADHPFAPAVEIQRNRLLITKFGLPLWRATSVHTSWTVYNVESDAAKPRVLRASPGNEVTSAASLLSDSDATDVAKRAIRLILNRYGVPMLPKSLSLSFYKALATKVAHPETCADVTFSLRGGFASRLLALVNTQFSKFTGGDGYIHPPDGYTDWRIALIWQTPDPECPCSYFNVIQPVSDEIIPTWMDDANPLPTLKSRNLATAASGHLSVRRALGSFNAHARPKNITKGMRVWWGESDTTHWKALITHVACDDNPAQISKTHLLNKRRLFQQLVPHHDVVDAVVKSLSAGSGSFVLDSPLLLSQRLYRIAGKEKGEMINRSFSEPEVITMATAWSTSLSDQFSELYQQHQLSDRARTLTFVVHIGHMANGKNGTTNLEVPPDVSKLVKSILKRVNVMFVGCVGLTNEYMQAFPELAIIIAAILSSQTCK